MTIQKFRSWVAAATCSGMLASPAAMAAPSGQPQPGDVALAEGGILSGQVVDSQGKPMAQAPVALISEGREVVRIAAAHDGSFALPGLQGGVYELATPGQHGIYRVWTAETAPPSASQGIMLVAGNNEVVRGQYGYAPPPLPPPPGPPVGPPVGPPMGPPPDPASGPGPISKTFQWMGQHPWVTAGIVGTAIAVPVAIAVTDDDAS